MGLAVNFGHLLHAKPMAESATPPPDQAAKERTGSSGLRRLAASPGFWGWAVGLGVFFVQAFWVKYYGVNSPWMDDWKVTILLQHYHAGTLTWGELAAQHVDHRLFLPRLIFIGLASLFGEWDLTIEMLFSALLAALIVGLLARTLRRLGVSVPAVLLAGWVLLSPMQWENMLWGFQLQFYLLVLLTVWAVSLVALAGHLGWRRHLGLAALCFGSSYSIGSGIFLWAIVLGCLLLAAATPWKTVLGFGDRGFRFVPLQAFVLAGVLCAFLYFHGYVEEAVELKTRRIATFFWWCARATSFPLLERPTFARSILAAVQWLTIGAAFFGYWKQRAEKTERAKLIFLGGMLGFLLLNAAVTGYRRGGYIEADAGAGLPSRYLTIFLWGGAIFVVAAADIIRRLGRAPSALRWVASMVLMVCTAAILTNHFSVYRPALDLMASNARHQRTATAAVVNYLRDASPGRQLHGSLPLPEPELRLLLDDPAMVAELPRWLQAGGRNLPARTEGDAWVPDGTFAARPTQDRSLVWGSWNHNDDLVGRLETEAMLLTSPVLILPVTGYPNADGNRLAIVSEDRAGEVVYDGPPPHEAWLEWRAEVSKFVGSRIRIVAVDGAKGAGGWFGFAVPWQRSRALHVIYTMLGWYDFVVAQWCMTVVIGYLVWKFADNGGVNIAPAQAGDRSP
jgi:hypothetical protein